jgi:hypothetical protein
MIQVTTSTKDTPLYIRRRWRRLCHYFRQSKIRNLQSRIGRFRPGFEPVECRTLLSTFLVTTTADSGSGSLRQAILDSNAAVGGMNTIRFGLPAPGIHLIRLQSPLPTITRSVVIDGSSQPGYAGAPLVEMSGRSLTGSHLLTVGAHVTLGGVAVDGLSFGAAGPLGVLTLQSVSLAAGVGGAGGTADSYRIDTAVGAELAALVHAADGLTTRLSLTDDQGHVLMTDVARSREESGNLIKVYVPPGSFVLDVQADAGTGTYTLTAALAPAPNPAQPIRVELASPFGVSSRGLRAAAGDFTGARHVDLAVLDNSAGTVLVLLGNGDGTFRPQVAYSVGSSPDALVAADFTGDGRTDLAVANGADNTVSLLEGNGDGTFQPQVTYKVGSDPSATLARDLMGDGRIDQAVAGLWENTASALLGDAESAFQAAEQFAAVTTSTAIAAGDFNGDGRLDLLMRATSSDFPSTSALAFWAVSGGRVQFYTAREGLEAAALAALSLGGGIAAESAWLAGSLDAATSVVAQLVPLQESSLTLVGSLLIVRLPSSINDPSLEPADAEAAAVATSARSAPSGAPASPGEGPRVQRRDAGVGGAANEPVATPEDGKPAMEAPSGSWKRFILRTDEAIEQFDRAHPELFPAPLREEPKTDPVGFTHPPAGPAPRGYDISAALAVAGSGAGNFYFGWAGNGVKARTRSTRSRWM